MANILLGVTGSVAAIHTPLLLDDLRQAGHQVKIVATHAALYFFQPAALSPTGRRDPDLVILDEDEWPGLEEAKTYQRGDEVLHIQLRRWADILLIAPLDANTLAKIALGLCDNCLTCVYRAWDRTRRIVLAPAMNTLMWEHPATARHLHQIASDLSTTSDPLFSGKPKAPAPALLAEDLLPWINTHLTNLRIVPPQTKKLACEDVGIGALADRTAIIEALN